MGGSRELGLGFGLIGPICLIWGDGEKLELVGYNVSGLRGRLEIANAISEASFASRHGSPKGKLDLIAGSSNGIRFCGTDIPYLAWGITDLRVRYRLPHFVAHLDCKIRKS